MKNEIKKVLNMARKYFYSNLMNDKKAQMEVDELFRQLLELLEQFDN